MDKEQKTKLEWFLNFLNLDFDNIPLGEKFRLSYETALIVNGYHPETHGTPEMIIENKRVQRSQAVFFGHDEMEELKCIQNHFKEFFDSIMKDVRLKLPTLKNWTSQNSLASNIVLKAFASKMSFGVIMNFPVNKFNTMPEMKLKKKGRQKKEAFYRFNTEQIEEFTFDLDVTTSNDEHNFIYQFLQTLKGVPIKYIRQCPDCNNWFLHTTKKEKEFCSNKCASRTGTRRRREKLREENPEDYQQELEKGSERAHQSYKKKVRAILPNAKV